MKPCPGVTEVGGGFIGHGSASGVDTSRGRQEEEEGSDTDLEIRTLRLNSAFLGTLGSVYPAVQQGRFHRR